MISAWWLLAAFLLGGVTVFIWYDLWGVRQLDKLAMRDAAQRAEEDRNYRLKLGLRKLQRIWPDMTADECELLRILNQLSGPQFESLVGRLYQRMGYAVQMVGAVGTTE